ncbi:FecR family protein [Bordetella genomosp. 1]|uniref:Peptidoglycan-binding protein n=1 Tax=Bordetella genomosp. 1 TaxID=1395607 RepID=A0ABX4F4U4_9BORD|nr:FecR domain-containing protein [Bordetella genomosp. 1]OZI68341.1 peptidoglycan-binding protein [Bordetella genomosp. 1]
MNRIARYVCAWIACALAPLAIAQPAGALGDDFIFRIRSGDTLIALAAAYTGSEANWSRLQSHNAISNPYALPVGMELHIPLSMIPMVTSAAQVVHVAGSASMATASLRAGMTVPEGGTITTAPDGFVTLRLSDATEVTIPPSTSITLERVRQFARVPLTDSVMRVNAGSVESRVAPAGQGVGRFEIRTPVAVTGVRGTRFRVDSSAQGANQTVLEGSVRLQPHAPDTAAAPASTTRPINVQAGQGAQVRADGSFAGVRALLPAPTLGEPTRGGAASVEVVPVPGAVAYRVRVSRDAQGMLLVSEQRAPGPVLRFTAPGAGTYHVGVSAIDAEGLAGFETRRPFEGANALVSAGGLPVQSGTGGIIILSDY